MCTFEVSHPYKPEAQIQTKDIYVEIFNFVPQEIKTYSCLSHHMLVSWVSPQPAMVEGAFNHPDSTSRLYEYGNIAFIPAAVPTVSHYRPWAEPRRAIVVRLAPDIFDRVGEEMAFNSSPLSMANLNIHDRDIQHATRLLAKEAMAPGFAATTMIESIGSCLTVQLARRFCQHRRSDVVGRKGLAPWQMRRIKERINDENTADSIPTLSELAALVGISTGHLRRAFKESTGCTIGEHIRHIQFERACALISGTSLPISVIAAQMGFSSPNGFTLAFQRIAGETPSAYRKQNRGAYSSI